MGAKGAKGDGVAPLTTKIHTPLSLYTLSSLAPLGRPTAWDVDGTPVPQGSLRPYMAGGRPVLVYSNREPLAMWRDAVRDACPITEPALGPCGVHMRFRIQRPRGHYAKDGSILPRFVDAMPCTRPDIDKLARAILDALTMRVWRDDAQVVDMHATLRYADTPGVTVLVSRA